MKKYHLTKKAFEDLSDIWTYTYDNWSEEQADKYYSILIDAMTEISADRICSSLVIRILHCSMDIKRHTPHASGPEVVLSRIYKKRVTLGPLLCTV